MINVDTKGMCQEATVVNFKAMSWDFFEGTGDNYERSATIAVTDYTNLLSTRLSSLPNNINFVMIAFPKFNLTHISNS